MLDLCAVYGGHVFRLEMATRDFAAECRTLISSGKVRCYCIRGGIVFELSSLLFILNLSDDAHSWSSHVPDHLYFYCKNINSDEVFLVAPGLAISPNENLCG